MTKRGTGTTPVAQLQLLDLAPAVKLTPRQQRALDLLREAGSNGLHADELGAMLHADYRKHAADERCVFDGANGNSILRALRRKGLARYKRGRDFTAGHWTATNNLATSTPAGMLRDDEPIPF